MLRRPGFADEVSTALMEKLTVNFSTIPGTDSFVQPTGVWATPYHEGDVWGLDMSRDNRVFGPIFVAVFPLFFGGFFWLVGGRYAGLVVGALALLCAGVYCWAMLVNHPELRRTVVLRGRRWVWNGADVDMDIFAGFVVMSLKLKTHDEWYVCLVGITPEGTPRLLTQYAGGRLIRVLQMAGYPVADGRFGLENPAPWPEWA